MCLGRSLNADSRTCGPHRATLSDHFFFSDYEAMHKLALMLRHLPLPMRDAYTFAISPADPDDPIISSALLSFATAYCQRCAVICCYRSKVANVHLPTPSLMDGHAKALPLPNLPGQHGACV